MRFVLFLTLLLSFLQSNQSRPGLSVWFSANELSLAGGGKLFFNPNSRDVVLNVTSKSKLFSTSFIFYPAGIQAQSASMLLNSDDKYIITSINHVSYGIFKGYNEDAVFTETNIVGEIESGKYRKGRFAVNYLTPGSQVSKPVNNLPYQLFQQVDRLERHLRLGAAYPVSDDGQSPNSFVTGRGLEELGQSASLHVREYQSVLANALEELDAKRL